MLEIRYRVHIPHPLPNPFSPWWRRVPEGFVHGAHIRFDGDTGTGRYLATAPPGKLEAFGEDLLAHPPPGAVTWRIVERSDEALLFDIVWKEPIFPGISSPMKIAHDVLGPDTLISFTFGREVIVHRHLTPLDSAPAALWERLREDLFRFCGYVGYPVSLEIERLGPWAPEDRLGPEVARRVHAAAFSLGYYDSPPRASVRDIAVAAQVPTAVALGHLKDLEAAILEVRERR